MRTPSNWARVLCHRLAPHATVTAVHATVAIILRLFGTPLAVDIAVLSVLTLVLSVKCRR